MRGPGSVEPARFTRVKVAVQRRATGLKKGEEEDSVEEERIENSSVGEREKRGEMGKKEFEFCSVCRMNHNDGRQHVFFPRHKRSLAQLLSRFLSKISDVRFFLRNPSFLGVEDASLNRFWCAVCEVDVDELDNQFACGNAICHLAGSEHLVALKSFLWKHGAGNDLMDKFRVSEEDFSKWQNRCSSMKSGESSSRPSNIGPSYNIHNETCSLDRDSSRKDSLRRIEMGVSLPPHIGVVGPSSDAFNGFDTNSFQNTMIQSFETGNLGNGVLPLQCFTHENYQAPYRVGGDATSGFGRSNQKMIAYTNCQNAREGLDFTSLTMVNQMSVGNNSSLGLSSSYGTTQGLGGGHTDFMALENLTRLPSISGDPASTVHAGAPPPWLDANKDLDSSMVRIENSIGTSSSQFQRSSKTRKQRKPERVGAAWAEKRKAELEKEKRGHAVDRGLDADWLPNFGRVWQSGSRKESRREFENERRKLLKTENASSCAPFSPLKLQPYISKRMRQNAVGCDGASSENG